MSTIQVAREELAELLELDSPYPAQRAAPPYTVIAESYPFIEQGEVFGTARVRFDVAHAVRDGDPAVWVAALDQQLKTTLAALVAAGWGFENVTSGDAVTDENQTRVRGFTLTAFTEITL